MRRPGRPTGARNGTADRRVASLRGRTRSEGTTPMTSEMLLYSVKQTAQLLGISRSLAYELVASGELPSVRIRGKLLIKPQDLERFVGALPYTGAVGSTGTDSERSSHARK